MEKENVKDQKYLEELSNKIINYISEKENLEINQITFSKNFYAYFTIKGTRNPEIIIDIELGTKSFTSLKSITTDSFGLDLFIKSYGLNFSNLSCYIFSVLHELGHVVCYKYMHDRLKTKFTNYVALRNIIDGAISTSLPIRRGKQFKENDRDFNYNFDPDELIATKYAYLHFYEVWKYLFEENNEIKEE